MQLAADRTARECRRVVVDVVRAGILAQVGTSRAGVRRCGAALLDVARARRRRRRHEQRHDDRAGNANGRLMDVARNTCGSIGTDVGEMSVTGAARAVA